MSVSLNVQIFLSAYRISYLKVSVCGNGGYMQSADLLFKETVQTIIQDRTALLRIYLWNMLKLVFWYVLPYLILIENHPKIDFY